MSFCKFLIRGDTKANWATANPTLKVREWGVEWEETVGVGEVKIKIGDGLTAWNDKDYALINNVTRKIVSTFAEVTAENPELEEGSTLELLWAVTKKKFEFLTNKINAINTLIGTFENITIESGGTTEAVSTITSAIQKLDSGKLSTADIYNGLDSTNVELALSAPQGKNLNDAVTQLNSNLAARTFANQDGTSLVSPPNDDGTKYIFEVRKDGIINLFRLEITGGWTYISRALLRSDITTISVDAEQYFIAPPSVWARLQKTANVVSLSFSGTMEIALPDNADTPIATIPQPYRPFVSAYGIFKVWPIRNASGEVTTPGEDLLLTITSNGQLLAVNRFGSDISLGSRYAAGNIIYIAAS